jgi:hypothetical protein
MYPALPISERIAVRDTVIPLSSCITTSTGEKISQIPVRKGQIVGVAIASYHRRTPSHKMHHFPELTKSSFS